MSQKPSQNRLKTVPKLSQKTVPKTVPKLSQNCPKTVPKLSQCCPKNCPKTVSKLSQNCPKKLSKKLPKNCPKTVPNLSQNCPQSVVTLMVVKLMFFNSVFLNHVSASYRRIWTSLVPNWRPRSPAPFWTGQNHQFRSENRQHGNQNIKFRKRKKSKNVLLKFFWTLFKIVHCRGPCSLRPCISRPYCTYLSASF